MGHEGTEIFGIVNILEDLQPVLGTTLGSIEDIVAGKNSGGQYLININQWSKYKPFRSSETYFANPAARVAAIEQANNGLNMATHNSASMATVINAAYNAVKNLTDEQKAAWTEWTYERPRGFANNEWFRIADFQGYNHAAIPPLHWHFFSSSVNRFEDADIMDDGSFDMGIETFPQLAGMNLGVAMRSQLGAWQYHIFASGVTTVTMRGAIGDYDCFFFYTTMPSQEIDAWGIDLDSSNYKYVLCPTPWSRVTLSNSSSFAAFRGKNPSVSAGYFRFELIVTKLTRHDVVLAYRKTGHYSRIAGGNTWSLNNQAAGESSTNVGTVAVPFGQYITTAQPCTDADDLLNRGAWFYTSYEESGWRKLDIEQVIQ